MENKYPKFADLLKRKMTQQSMSVNTMAKALGSNRGSVSQWRNGLRLPEARFLGGIADLLDAPGLVRLAQEYRSGYCDECMMPFISHPKNGTRQRYCGPSCKSSSNKRRARERNATSRPNRITTAEVRRQAAEKARDEARQERKAALDLVAAFCRSCEWDGVCKTADCELRAISPLPLVRKGVA